MSPLRLIAILEEPPVGARNARQPARVSLSSTAQFDESAQIAPAVATVKLAGIAVKALGAERLVKAVRWTGRITEEQHRWDTAFDEPTRDRAEKQPSEPMALNALKQIDLVEFSSVARHAPSCGVPFANPTNVPSSSSMT